MINELAKKLLLDNDTIELKDLVGKHILSGVSRDKVVNENIEAANTFSFILDGITFTAIEDPNDGWRSSMDRLIIGGTIKNTFQDIEVECSLEEQVLTIIDEKNNKTVLRVGTDDYDDWYPTFINEWIPENLSLNEGIYE